MNIIYFILIGITAGWLAGKLMKGSGFGLVMNLIVGVIGAVLGGFVLGLLNVTTAGLLGELVSATIGAMILIFLLGRFGRNL